MVATLSAVPANAATVTVSPNVGPPATQTTVTGAGFAANAIMDVYFDLTQVAFQATNASGGFSLPLKTPASAVPGPHTITVLPHFGSGAAAQNAFVIRTNWLNWRGDAAGTGWNQTENVITQGTVDNLVNVWNVRPGVGVYAAPIVAGLNVYFVSGDGHLRAHNRTTGVQVFDIAADANPLTPPVYGAGLIFHASDVGKLIARSSVNGALVWQANLPPGVGAPVVSGSVVYVVAEGGATAGLFAFATNCNRAGGFCTPLWRGASTYTTNFKYPEGSLAVANGFVYANMDTSIYQFRVGCGTGGAVCTPVCKSGSDGYSPTVSNNYVYFTYKDSAATPNYFVTARRAHCITYSAWSGLLPGPTKASVAVGNNRVFVGHATPTGGGVSAYSAACGSASCAPIWTAPQIFRTTSPSTVSGYLAFTPNPNDLTAFPVYCSGSCSGVWHAGSGGVFNNAAYGSATIVDGFVYSPDEIGLSVYSLPPGSMPTPPKVEVSKLKPSPEFAAAERKLAAELANSNLRAAKP